MVMVEFRLVHAVTTEMCTGFLTLASVGILVKFLSDGYMKFFFGKVRLFDKIATVSSRYSEPAWSFALGAGIFMTFVSMVTGTLSWPLDVLFNSELAHNKVLLTITSQALFIGVFILRTKYTYEIWMNRLTTWLYLVLAMSAFAFIIFQNSVAGQMVGKGSIIDPILEWLNVNEKVAWTFPVWASAVLILVTIAVVVLAYMFVKNRGEHAQKPSATA